VLALMTPLFGVALGAWLLHENIDTPFLVGGTLVIVGMVVVNGREWLNHVRTRWA
jgi:drug/metabolite transporter (DMT)-like permease